MTQRKPTKTKRKARPTKKAETTEQERKRDYEVGQDLDPGTGQFLKGKIGGPGRPLGSRNKLGEQFLGALQQDFEAHGKGVIEKVREEKPDQYLKVVASLMPKDVNLKVSPLEELTDEQLASRIRQLEATIRPFLTAQGDGRASNGSGAETKH